MRDLASLRCTVGYAWSGSWVQLFSYVLLDFPKSAVRGSWKRRTFVTRKRAKFTGAFLLRWRQWMLIIILY
jgi:hypothetical protein